MFLFTGNEAFALEIASPGQIYVEQDLEKAETVLKNESVGGFVSPGGSVSINGNSIVNGTTGFGETKKVRSVEMDELDYPVLVLDEYILEYASNGNLKKDVVKSVGANSTIYGSLTSSTVINLFDHYVNSLNPFVSYVGWRETQYIYTLVYGDIKYDNGRFTGSGSYVRFDTSNYNDYLVSRGNIASFGLNPQQYIVYSNEMGFPDLGGGVNEKIKDILLLVPFVYIVLWHIFDSVPRGFRK